MNFKNKLILSVLGMLAAGSVFAAPMPNAIVIEDKAVVPIVKTQVIRTMPGREPVRTVNATIFEVTNKGKDVVARDVVIVDDKAQFSDEKMKAQLSKLMDYAMKGDSKNVEAIADILKNSYTNKK